MALWRIKAYWLPGDFCPLQAWYVRQDIPVQAEFDATLAILQAEPDWADTKAFKALHSRHIGLGEVRFSIDKPHLRRFRPVGIWPPIVDYEFILLLGCEKERGVYVPANAFDQALIYKQQFERGEGEAHDYL